MFAAETMIQLLIAVAIIIAKVMHWIDSTMSYDCYHEPSPQDDSCSSSHAGVNHGTWIPQWGELFSVYLCKFWNWFILKEDRDDEPFMPFNAMHVIDASDCSVVVPSTSTKHSYNRRRHHHHHRYQAPVNPSPDMKPSTNSSYANCHRGHRSYSPVPVNHSNHNKNTRSSVILMKNPQSANPYNGNRHHTPIKTSTKAASTINSSSTTVTSNVTSHQRNHPSTCLKKPSSSSNTKLTWKRYRRVGAARSWEHQRQVSFLGKQSLSNDNDNNDSTAPLGKRRRITSTKKERRVKFGTIQIRDYEVILGDHPVCKNGPAVSLGWSYTEINQFDVASIADGCSCTRYGEESCKSRKEFFMKADERGEYLRRAVLRDLDLLD